MPILSQQILRRALGERSERIVPSSVIVPEIIRISGAAISALRTVLLPQPLSPTRQRISPFCREKDTSAAAVCSV